MSNLSFEHITKNSTGKHVLEAFWMMNHFGRVDGTVLDSFLTGSKKYETGPDSVQLIALIKDDVVSVAGLIHVLGRRDRPDLCATAINPNLNKDEKKLYAREFLSSLLSEATQEGRDGITVYDHELHKSFKGALKRMGATHKTGQYLLFPAKKKHSKKKYPTLGNPAVVS